MRIKQDTFTMWSHEITNFNLDLHGNDSKIFTNADT